MHTTPDGTASGAHNDRPETGHQIFDWIRSTGLYRPDGAWAGGVFAALAEKLRWDSALVRGLGVVALILFTSPTLLFYGLAWLFLPDPRGYIHAQQALRGSYPSGLWGAAVLAFLGAVNVFTPNIIGPFAVLLNVVIIGIVAWVVWLLISNHRKRSGGTTSPKARPSEPEEPASDAAPDTGQRDENPREDGRPAWFPKEGPANTPQSAPTAAGTAPASSAAVSAERQAPAEAPAVGDARRRRRMLSFGLLLLAIPALGGAAWAASQLGLATSSAVLLGLAAVVVLLALMHLNAALRGRPGHPGMLTTFTALLMLVFFAEPLSTGSNNVFGNYLTSSQEVNTAFANTTVDLRDLSFTADDAVDLSDPQSVSRVAAGEGLHSSVELNNVFANTVVVVPDEVYVHVDYNNFLANTTYHTVDGETGQSGISSASFGGASGEEPIGAVGLGLNNVFGNVTVYDETTYQREELGMAENTELSEDHAEERR